MMLRRYFQKLNVGQVRELSLIRSAKFGYDGKRFLSFCQKLPQTTQHSEPPKWGYNGSELDPDEWHLHYNCGCCQVRDKKTS